MTKTISGSLLFVFKRQQLTTSILVIIFMFSNLLSFSQENSKQILIDKIDSLKNIVKSFELEKKSIEQKINITKQEIKSYNKSLNEVLMNEKNGTNLICAVVTKLYDEPYGNTLTIIAKGDTVKVIENQKDHYYLFFNGFEGYAYKEGFLTEETVKLRAERKAEQKAEQEKQKVEKRKLLDEQKKQKKLIALENRKKKEQQKLNTLINKYGKTNGTKIHKGIIWIGMTKEMALESLGKPNDINRTVGSWGVNEQWVYPNNLYVYIQNGILKSWQD